MPALTSVIVVTQTRRRTYRPKEADVVAGQELTGKVALVTAGSRGIGRGIVEELLERGATVVLTGRSEEKGAAALAELGQPERTAFLSGDARSREVVESWVDQTVAEFGRIDILVNNAGGSDGFALVGDLSEEAWQNAITFILHSAFWATRRALPQMEKQGYGRVINISSLEGKVGNKAMVAHYVTAKHGMNGLTKAVAFEYGGKGITCNAICPGAIETDLMVEVGPKFAEENGMTYEEYKANYAKDASIGRLNTVEEVAALAALLASDLGGGFNAAILSVDGGSAPY